MTIPFLLFRVSPIPKSFFFSILCFRSCHLGDSAFYGAFFAPVCIVLLANTTLLIKCNLTMRTRQRQSLAISNLDGRSTGTKMKCIFGLSCLLSLTWLLGVVPVANSARIYVQYIFAILNTFQGVSILLLQLALNRDLRDKLTESVEKGIHRFSLSSSETLDRFKTITLPRNSSTGQRFSLSGGQSPPTLPRHSSTGQRYSIPGGNGCTDSLPRAVHASGQTDALEANGDGVIRFRTSGELHKGCGDKSREGGNGGKENAGSTGRKKEEASPPRNDDKNGGCAEEEDRDLNKPGSERSLDMNYLEGNRNQIVDPDDTLLCIENESVTQNDSRAAAITPTS